MTFQSAIASTVIVIAGILVSIVVGLPTELPPAPQVGNLKKIFG